MLITFLELGWEDATDYKISDDDFVRCVDFIHSARCAGGSVLVHCAQVRHCLASVAGYNESKLILSTGEITLCNSSCGLHYGH